MPPSGAPAYAAPSPPCTEMNTTGPSRGTHTNEDTDQWAKEAGLTSHSSLKIWPKQHPLSEVCPGHPHQGSDGHSLLPGSSTLALPHYRALMLSPASDSVLLGERAFMFTVLSVPILSVGMG